MKYTGKGMLAVLVLLVLAISAPLLAGTPADVVVITIKGFRFEPAEITVTVGTTVRWENHEKRQYHNVYFESLGDKQSDYFFPDETRERTFEKAGTYPYICEPHLGSHKMKGVIHVVE